MVMSSLEGDSFMQPSKILLESARGLFVRLMKHGTERDDGGAITMAMAMTIA